MPAIYAHTVFGYEVLNKLNPTLKTIINDHLDFYLIGVNGPDILFYNEPLKKNNINQLGYGMHQKSAYDFFMHAKEVIKTIQDKDAALAYISGFVNHFILDSECHGYIGNIEKSQCITHAEIESDFDRQLLANQGYTPRKVVLSQYIHYNDDIASVIAPFFQISHEDVKKSLKGMKFFLNVLHCSFAIKKHLLFFGMKLVGVYPSMHGLVVQDQPHPKCIESTQFLVSHLYESVDLAVHILEDYMKDIDNDQVIDQRFDRNFE